MAEALLKGSSNLWLSAGYLINRGSVAWLNCEFEAASKMFRLGRDIASRIGYEHLTQAADVCSAYTHLATGEFGEAEEIFAAVYREATTNLASQLSALDGLARTYLASGRMADASAVVEDIKSRVSTAERAELIYHVRWPSITEARLLISEGKNDEAIVLLSQAEHRFQGHGDIPLTAAAHLTHAQAASRKGDLKDSATQLLRASELGIAGMRDLQPEYYVGCALAIGGPSKLANQLRERAQRLWATQGVVSAPCEVNNAFGVFECYSTSKPPIESVSTECIADALAAMSDLAARPRLLADEMLSVIRALECSPQIELVESPIDEMRREISEQIAVANLGCEGGTSLSLLCKFPEDPLKAVLLADVLRVGRSAVELERSRKEERNRAAVWPATPTEEQAGALFVAEEMQELLAIARRVAGTTVPVLITGETGTGKEVLARTIHAHSARAAATFLPFNCSSVPKDMLDSQLFGHRRGSFTGASEHFPGVIRAASGGTLFLDEIGETTLDVQPKLLRFLDSNEVHPIGEVHPVKADVRVIAATNVDLDAFVAQGRFREDLFYRLNIVRLPVPPLRERRVEIPILANHYLHKHALEYRKGDLRLAEETMEYLLLYRWPGNVRQLANEMRRLAALAETNAVMMPEHLSSDIATSRRTIPASQRVLDANELVVRLDQPVPAAVQHLERTMIQYAMKICGGRLEETAAMLGLSRKGLYLKRQRYGLEPAGTAPTEEVA